MEILTTKKYIETPTASVHKVKQFNGKNFRFFQYEETFHTSDVIMKKKNSPDLNPIKNVQGEMKKAVTAKYTIFRECC